MSKAPGAGQEAKSSWAPVEMVDISQVAGRNSPQVTKQLGPNGPLSRNFGILVYTWRHSVTFHGFATDPVIVNRKGNVSTVPWKQSIKAGRNNKQRGSSICIKRLEMKLLSNAKQNNVDNADPTQHSFALYRSWE